MAQAKERNPAVAVAKQRGPDNDVQEVTLSTGHRAVLTPVATSLLEKVRRQIKDPPIPMWENPDKAGRKEPNPLDPTYRQQLDEAESQRSDAIMDALILFGVELVGGVPDDDGWLKKLRMLERHGQIDLGDLDLEDPMDREFAYKKYVAISADDYLQLMTLSGVTAQGVAEQVDSFPSN